MFGKLYLQNSSLPLFIGFLFAVFAVFLCVSVRRRSLALIYFGASQMCMAVFYAASFYASVETAPGGAYHRFASVLGVLLALVFMTQFFFHFPRASDWRFSRWLLYGQLALVVPVGVVFCVSGLQAERMFRFAGHYWDLQAEAAGRLVATTLLLLLTATAIAAVVRALRLPAEKRRGVWGMLGGFLVSQLLPAVAVFLFRTKILDVRAFVNVLTGSLAVGYLILFVVLVNYTRSRISLRLKIMSIFLVTFLVALQAMGALGAAAAERAYFNSKLAAGRAIAYNQPQGSAVGYAIRRTPKSVGFLQPSDARATESVTVWAQHEDFDFTSFRGEFFLALRFAMADPGESIEAGFPYVGYRQHMHVYMRRFFALLAVVLVVMILGSRYFFQGALMHPLALLVEGLNRVNRGDLDVKLRVVANDEIGFLAISFNRMVHTIRQARDELQQYTANLEKKIRETDSLENQKVRVLEAGTKTLTFVSKSMQAVVEKAERIAALDQPVLIHGETGTGKEVIASLLHKLRFGQGRPLVDVNCAAIPHGLWESEIFGHVRGAFTDARADRLGLVAQARGGTLFFDEIGEMPADVQPKILRLLQEKTYKAVGGKETLAADCRIVFATHRDLKQMVADGQFRADLYYRINVFEINIAPLRERRTDIPVLLRWLLERYCGEMGKALPSFDEDAMQAILWYSWPGNIRELENCVIQLVGGLVGDHVTLADLPVDVARSAGSSNGAEPSGPGTRQTWQSDLGFEQLVHGYSRELITAALSNASGNKSEAARLLKISRGKLQYQMKSLGMDD